MNKTPGHIAYEYHIAYIAQNIGKVFSAVNREYFDGIAKAVLDNSHG